MPAPRLADLGKIIVKKAPRSGGIYFAKESSPAGVIPAHLEKYTASMKADAQACAAQTKGLSGNDRVRAMNGCIAMKRRK